MPTASRTMTLLTLMMLLQQVHLQVPPTGFWMLRLLMVKKYSSWTWTELLTIACVYNLLIICSHLCVCVID